MGINMKLFLIRFNECGWDQYDAFVVAAASKKEGIDLLKKKYPKEDEQINWEKGYTTKEIKPEKIKESTIILASYHAG